LISYTGKEKNNNQNMYFFFFEEQADTKYVVHVENTEMLGKIKLELLEASAYE
jgi:hypothetical protein